jgi:hypothetical protein
MKSNRWILVPSVLALAGVLPGCIVESRARGTLYLPEPTVNAQITVPSPPPQQTSVVVQPQATAVAVQPQQSAVVVQAQVQVPQGVVVVQAQCAQGAPEQCNGIDDNCNGVIDEGCGYQSGAIQITAAWNSASDIDLHVTDPMGEHIYYGDRQSNSGGVLDHDANAGCSVQPPTVENVYWSTPAPPRGTYQVRVHAFSMCGSYQTPVTLSISVGGRVIGTYSYTMTHQGDEFVVPFTIQ